MEEKKTTTRAAERALDILLCFVGKPELAMREIVEKTELSKSTVFRLLATLEAKGFVKRDADTEKYSLGFRIWELANHINRSDDPAILFLPEMERLRDDIDETVSLYVRDGLERVRIQAVESQQAIRRVAPIGARLPLSVGASSKVIVAYTEGDLLGKVLFDPMWPSGIDRDLYINQLQEIRARGYAISMEEREAGTAAISVAIHSRSGNLVAALVLSGPISRMNEEQMIRYVPRLVKAAEEMGKLV
ncbi:transcriptional regulator, IclR family [Thermoactinomyces sp. DSM 45891]|uniref:IclR family transcriptional regulator n=1 Tax=Thermoactinomyces sp. DSM 45891 TaxID=1761907 RepID=UPI000916076C|nr:IclR family transcriptional regulator [Thermoactinomyces sp. DSM 45891]SFX17844.1 transcriptional regulator, IclR family [Thermoactinomyces sp. DSM 45891]